MMLGTLVRFFAAPLTLLVAASACQSYPLTYKGEASSTVTQSSVVVGQSNKTDILFVIDNSGSMESKQNDLRSNAAAFIAELAKSTTSYHLGVITTDLYAPTDSGRLRVDGATAGPYYWSSPESDAPDADARRQAIITGFDATVHSLGTNGSPNEAGLGAALAALTSTDPDVQKHNDGFLRQDADLAIIVLSDEDDCSPLSQNMSLAASWTADESCYANLNDLYPVQALVDLFAQVKGDVSRVRVGLITGGILDANDKFVARACDIGANNKPTDNCGCWANSNSTYFCNTATQPRGAPCTGMADATGTKCPDGRCAINGVCSANQCPATPASRYVSFIDALAVARDKAGFASGVRADSICQNDYHAALVALANDVVLSNCFTLPAPAVSAEDIRVMVSHQQPDGMQSASTLLPRFDPKGGADACNACDGSCKQGAWQYQGARNVCLACGAQQQLGDKYDFSVLSNLTGNANTLP